MGARMPFNVCVIYDFYLFPYRVPVHTAYCAGTGSCIIIFDSKATCDVRA